MFLICIAISTLALLAKGSPSLSPRIISHGCTTTQRAQIGNALNDAQVIADLGKNNSDDDDWNRWFGGSDATAVAGVYSTISSYKLYDPRFNVICDTDNAQPDCQAEGVYAFTDTNPGAGASPIIYLCGLWFSAPPNLGCVNPSSQGDDFNAQYQDTTFLHELTHLQTSIFGKPILDRPPATSDIPSDPDCFNVECVKGFVADAISSSPYAAAYRTQWVAQAYVFFGWSLYANSPSCAGS